MRQKFLSFAFVFAFILNLFASVTVDAACRHNKVIKQYTKTVYSSVSNSEHKEIKVYNRKCKKCKKVVKHNVKGKSVNKSHQINAYGKCKKCTYEVKNAQDKSAAVGITAACRVCGSDRYDDFYCGTTFEKYNSSSHKMIHLFNRTCLNCTAIIQSSIKGDPITCSHSFKGSVCTECGYSKGSQSGGSSGSVCKHNIKDYYTTTIYQTATSTQHNKIPIYTSKCAYCGSVTATNVQGDPMLQNHKFSGSKCSLCGYKKLAGCSHVIKDYYQTTVFEQPTSTQHDMVHIFTSKCSKCGYVSATGVRGTPIKANHILDHGECIECGYRQGVTVPPSSGVCQHSNFDDKYTSTVYEQANSTQHKFINLFERVCLDCDTVINTRVEGDPVLENHHFVYGECVECDYKQGASTVPKPDPQPNTPSNPVNPQPSIPSTLITTPELSYTWDAGQYIFVNNPECIRQSDLADHNGGWLYSSVFTGRTRIYVEQTTYGDNAVGAFRYGIQIYNPDASAATLTLVNGAADKYHDSKSDIDNYTEIWRLAEQSDRNPFTGKAKSKNTQVKIPAYSSIWLFPLNNGQLAVVDNLTSFKDTYKSAGGSAMIATGYIEVLAEVTSTSTLVANFMAFDNSADIDMNTMPAYKGNRPTKQCEGYGEDHREHRSPVYSGTGYYYPEATATLDFVINDSVTDKLEVSINKKPVDKWQTANTPVTQDYTCSTVTYPLIVPIPTKDFYENNHRPGFRSSSLDPSSLDPDRYLFSDDGGWNGTYIDWGDSGTGWDTDSSSSVIAQNSSPFVFETIVRDATDPRSLKTYNWANWCVTYKHVIRIKNSGSKSRTVTYRIYCPYCLRYEDARTIVSHGNDGILDSHRQKKNEDFSRNLATVTIAPGDTATIHGDVLLGGMSSGIINHELLIR